MDMLVGQTIAKLGRHPPNVQLGTADTFDQRRNQKMFLKSNDSYQTRTSIAAA
jgi:hypothetical protein